MLRHDLIALAERVEGFLSQRGLGVLQHGHRCL